MTAAASALRPCRRLPRWMIRALVFGGILFGLVAIWESYTAVGQATGNLIPFDFGLAVRNDDSSIELME